jgi:hypothetical protein
MFRVWEVEYSNDTGASDECFVETWSITNGVFVYDCNSGVDALALCDFLNKHKFQPEG